MHLLIVRSAQTPMALMNEVQQAVWATDPGVALVYPDAFEHAISQGIVNGALHICVRRPAVFTVSVSLVADPPGCAHRILWRSKGGGNKSGEQEGC